MQEKDSKQILFIPITDQSHLNFTFHTIDSGILSFCASFSTKCMRLEEVWFHMHYFPIRFRVESAAGRLCL
jgi:hypothetical protein